MNEYLAIDSGGHVSDLVVARNCCMARISVSGLAKKVAGHQGLMKSCRPKKTLFKLKFRKYPAIHTVDQTAPFQTRNT